MTAVDTQTRLSRSAAMAQSAAGTEDAGARANSRCARRASIGGESPACVIQIIGGIAMLAGGLALLIAVS